MRRLIEITYQTTTYSVWLTRKRMKRITMRPSPEGLLVSAPVGVSLPFVKATIIKHMPKLVGALQKEAPISSGHLYFLGHKYHNESDYLKMYFSRPLSDFEAPLFQSELRKIALRYFTSRVRHYEAIMKVDRPYQVKIRKMSARLGSNTKKNHTLTFALNLIHYSVPIIDAVVVHELAHHYAFDHSRNFYEILLKYYPNYKVEHQKIRQGFYS
ncbi:MAG TPA: DUF45 domain-containing protein [Bacilli bacterium]|nr:DUF45 domain-containing protein [Bacilli bacterium]